MKTTFDVAIIGSGFAGSILAWILAKHGRRVALIDAASHPRFAIGESSTPIADLVLRRLGDKHAIAELVNLSTFGSWQKHHPEISCGKKRGFSYYVHSKGQLFAESDRHEHSLLVAASASDAVADTHWYRSEVDAFLHARAIESGAIDFANQAVVNLTPDDEAFITLSGGQTIRSTYVIDASGQACVMARLLGMTDLAPTLATNTRCTFAHYRGVASWSAATDTDRFPFDSDDAAQHHLIDDGWLWMLRFNNGITSVGRTTTSPRVGPIVPDNYPTIEQMFSRAKMIAPDDGPRVSGRLQRLFQPAVSQTCWMLPTAAATIDPLHSTGIAHALAGVDRTVDLILSGADQPTVMQYAQTVTAEARFLDLLISTAYRSMHEFSRFTTAGMLYFAAAIGCEERYQQGETPSHLFNADDNAFVSAVESSCSELVVDIDPHVIADRIRLSISPWNTAGLLDPTVHNRYAYTATKR
ncbi:MAG: FAD-dependent oxidoreductase [Pirellulaceae bacterium]|nr:FAD-dependent oxidoreductase [Pirellulaceae bacterium]